MSFFGLFGESSKSKQARALALQQQQQAHDDAVRAAEQARQDAATNAQAAAAAQAKQEEAAAAAAALVKRQGDIGTARDIALRTGQDTIKQWGLDPTQYGDKLTASIQDLIASLGDTKDPYSTLDGSQVASRLLNNEQTSARNRYTQEANSKFGADYSNKVIDPHLLDGTINDILNEQSTSAHDYLDRGKARGIYNDVGYSAGAKALDNQAAAGRSQIASTADNVLDSYRTKEDAVRDKAYGAASGYTLGNTINLDDYVGMGNDIATKAHDFGAGDLRTALGGQNFFDFSGLTNAAGGAQGATNLRDSNIAAVLADRNNKKLATRGLGSQGAF